MTKRRCALRDGSGCATGARLGQMRARPRAYTSASLSDASRGASLLPR